MKNGFEKQVSIQQCVDVISSVYRMKRKELEGCKKKLRDYEAKLYSIEKNEQLKKVTSLSDYEVLKIKVSTLHTIVDDLTEYCDGMEMARELIMNL